MHANILSILRPVLEIIGWQAYAVMIYAMLAARWWRRYTVFFTVQCMQFAMQDVLLYWWLTRNSLLQKSESEIFWVNIALECLLIGYMFRQKWYKSNGLTVTFYAMIFHLQAKYIHYRTWDTFDKYTYGLEYGIMLIWNVLVMISILWAIHYKRGDCPQE